MAISTTYRGLDHAFDEQRDMPKSLSRESPPENCQKDPGSQRSAVENAVIRLDDALATLDGRLAALHDRLSPVLGPDHPEPEGRATKPPSGNSSVVAAVDRSYFAVSHMTERLSILMSRLEI